MNEEKQKRTVSFAAIAEAARSLSAARGGEKQPTGPDVLVMRFAAPTMRQAMALALKPLEGHAVPVPYRIYGIRTPYENAVVDVEIRLDTGS